MSRPETGPMQFGDDWPGIFIRGDAALAVFMTLLEHLAALPDDPNTAIERKELKELANLLSSCEIQSPLLLENIQKCRAWKECDLVYTDEQSFPES